MNGANTSSPRRTTGNRVRRDSRKRDKMMRYKIEAVKSDDLGDLIQFTMAAEFEWMTDYLSVAETQQLIEQLQKAVSPLLLSAIEPDMPTAPYRIHPHYSQDDSENVCYDKTGEPVSGRNPSGNRADAARTASVFPRK